MATRCRCRPTDIKMSFRAPEPHPRKPREQPALWTKFRIMQTIQVAVDEHRLRAADSAGRRKQIDRSALVRDARSSHRARVTS